MTNDFNLMSQKWLDLIFKDKNKAYGAYEMRKSSSDRHLKALIIVTIIGLVLVYLPTFIKSVIPEKKDLLMESAVVEMIDVNLEAEVPEENQIREIENIPPPPILKETVAFTPPKIVHDDEVNDEDLMLTQQELTDHQADISIQTVDGAKEGGVDIADLQEHKVVVQEEAPPQVYTHVEVPPQFPGGDAELMKWLYENISYPVIAQEQGIQGQVVLRFVVGPDGSVGQIEILKSLDPSCDREAQRVVGRMPKWIPGKQNGNPVYVYYNLPVRFQLQN